MIFSRKKIRREDTMKNISIHIPIDPSKIGRIPISKRPPQVFKAKKGKGSYRRISRSCLSMMMNNQ
jgi:hypothetical protein